MPVLTAPHAKLRSRSLSRRAFWRRYGRIEHEQLEFKTSVNHLQESVVAMAMTAGGTILVGVSDARELVGHAIDQAALDRVAHVAHETQVELRTACLLAGGTPVLAITVPAVRDRVVTTADGRLLRRLGGTNRPLRGDAVARFVGERLGAVAAAAG
jgi:predicted HTH transcriptional regulator